MNEEIIKLAKVIEDHNGMIETIDRLGYDDVTYRKIRSEHVHLIEEAINQLKTVINENN